MMGGVVSKYEVHSLLLGSTLLLLSLVSMPAWADADLELSASVDDLFPELGQSMAVTFYLNNHGPDPVADVLIEIAIPTNFQLETYLTSLGSFVYVPEVNLAQWSIPFLPAGGEATLTLEGSFPVAVGESQWMAEVQESNQPDLDSEDDQVILEQTVVALGTMGGFSSSILLIPEGTQTESVQFELPISNNFSINLTFSGLVLALVTQFDLTGLKAQTLTLNMLLGAFELTNQLSFKPSNATILALDTSTFSLVANLLDLNISTSFSLHKQAAAWFSGNLAVGGSVGDTSITISSILGNDPSTLALTVSRLQVSIANVTLDPLTIQSVTSFAPGALPFNEVLSLSFPLWDLFKVSSVITLDPTAFKLQGISAAVNHGILNLNFNWDPQLNLSNTTASFNLNVQEGISLRTAIMVNPITPAVNFLGGLSVSIDPLTLASFVVFEREQLKSAGFTLAGTILDVSFSFGSTFGPDGMQAASFSFSVGF